MKKNIGSSDKLIRLVISIILIVFYYKQILSGTLGIISLFIALGLTLTSLVGFCPIYGMFGWKTDKTEEK
jgi:hypothetical protein